MRVVWQTRLFETEHAGFLGLFFFFLLRGSAVDRQLFGFRSTGTVSAINYSWRLAACMHTGLTLCHCKCNATHTLWSYVNQIKKKKEEHFRAKTLGKINKHTEY